jgi:hypothetical protein
MSSEEAAVRDVIEVYVAGTREGKVEKIRQVFHPQIRMSGYLQGNLLVGGPEPFYDAVANAPAPAKSGEPYQWKIVSLAVAGPAAAATLEEGPYLGMQFTTFFHLLKIDNRWQIVSKTFMHR